MRITEIVNKDKEYKVNEHFYAMDYDHTTDTVGSFKPFRKFIKKCTQTSIESSNRILASDLMTFQSAAASAKQKFYSYSRTRLSYYCYMGIYLCYFVALCTWPLLFIHQYAPYYFYQRVFLIEVALVVVITACLWVV